MQNQNELGSEKKVIRCQALMNGGVLITVSKKKVIELTPEDIDRLFPAKVLG